jgi:Photosynthetic reaction centre cytochrome C subunit
MRTVLLVCLAASVFAQQPVTPPPAAGEAPRPQGQRPAPRNLKILKPEEVRAAMQSYTVALGKQCTFCHVQGNMASDDNPHKEIARTMIAMTRELNAKLANGDDKTRVSCYTCHRGDEHPATAPPAADAQATPAPGATTGVPVQPPK